MKYIIINKENEEENVCDFFFDTQTEAEHYLNANYTEQERENLKIVSGEERASYVGVDIKDAEEWWYVHWLLKPIIVGNRWDNPELLKGGE